MEVTSAGSAAPVWLVNAAASFAAKLQPFPYQTVLLSLITVASLGWISSTALLSPESVFLNSLTLPETAKSEAILNNTANSSATGEVGASLSPPLPLSPDAEVIVRFIMERLERRIQARRAHRGLYQVRLLKNSPVNLALFQCFLLNITLCEEHTVGRDNCKTLSKMWQTLYSRGAFVHGCRFVTHRHTQVVPPAQHVRQGCPREIPFFTFFYRTKYLGSLISLQTTWAVVLPLWNEWQETILESCHN